MLRKGRILLFFVFYSLALVLIGEVELPAKAKILMLLVPAISALVFFIYGIYWALGKGRHTGFLLALGALWSLSLAWVFKWSALGMGGGLGDSWILHSMVNKFRYFWANVDFTFKGLHSFYPFYFHYFLGKIAWALGLPAYQVVKYFPIVFSLLLPFLIYRGFRIFLSPISALGSTLLLILFEGDFFVYKPYEFLSLVFLVPWWIYFVEEDRGNPLLGGLLGGLIFASYYYWFLPFFFLLLVRMGKILLQGGLKKFWGSFKRKFLVFAVLLLVSSPYWAWYLWDVVTRGGEFMQHTFFRISHLKFVPLDTGVIRGGPLLWGIVFLALFYLFKRYKREKEARFFLSLLLISYFTYLVGNLAAFIFLSPILQFKLNYLLTLIFVISFSLWLDDFLRNPEYSRAGAVFFLLVSSFFLYRVYFLGSNRFFVKGMSQKAVKVREDERVLFGKTVLGLNPRVLNFIPSYLFLYYGARTAHPSARVNERLAFLYLMSFSSHPDFFLYMLENNRFSPVDFLYLGRKRSKLCVKKYFPDYPNIYKFRDYFFCFKFTPEEIKTGEPVRNIYEKGDMAIKLRRVEGPGEMTSLEEFILSKFGKNPPRLKPQFQVGPMEVYQLGRYLVFYSENCDSLLKFNLLDFLSPLSRRGEDYEKGVIFRLSLSCPGQPVRRVRYSIKKHGIVGRVCVRVIKVEEGCRLLGVERYSGKP